MPRGLIPFLFPLGLLVVVVALALSTILAVVLAVVGGLVGVPFAYRAYQANRPGGGDGKPPRADPPNNRSLLR
jgi:Flp pilus assembly protein protease CpaA